MEGYVWISLGAALALALSALTGKVLLRYRICSAGLVTWAQGVSISLISGLLCIILRLPFPKSEWLLVACFAGVLLAATRVINQALQEGDASTVVPLLGLKIPLSSLLAWLILKEAVSPIIWLAVLFAGGAVALFGMGRQGAAQGGHGRNPRVAITLALCAALLFSVADIIVRVASADIELRAMILWSNVLWGPIAAVMLSRRYFRQYNVTRIDVGLFALGSVFVIAAMMSLYHAFELADSVVLPNVILGTRGLFALIAGFLLSKAARTPIERQPGSVYLYRAIGTALVIAALVLLHIKG